MTALTRTLVISYGAFDTNDTGVDLDGVHSITEDQDAFSITFDVIVESPTTAASGIVTPVGAMLTELGKENQRIKVTVSTGVTTHDYTATLDDVNDLAGPKCAEFTRAEWDLVDEEPRSSLVRKYRITLTAVKPALQTGKTGKRRQSASLTTGADGLRSLAVEVEFTPDEDGNTAYEVYADATNGFDAVVDAYRALFDLESGDGVTFADAPTELTGIDEDARGLLARRVLTELPFAESAAGTNDSTITDVVYSVRASRKAGTGANVAGLLNVRPLTEIVVSFSASVIYAGSQLDLDSVISGTILTYLESTIAPRMQSDATLQVMGHSLTASDLPRPRVAGEVLFLAAEGGLLAASVVETEQRRPGRAYPDVLDGGEFSVDEHIGPGRRFAQVAIVTEELGDATPSLDSAVTALAQRYASRGFKEIGRDTRRESSTRAFQSPYGDSETLTTTTGQTVLLFRYVEVRESTAGGASNVLRTVTRG